MKGAALFSRLLRDTIREWNNDKASRWAAALAYYMVFSLSPILVIVVGVSGIFLGQKNAQDEVVEIFDEWIGREGAEVAENMIDDFEGQSGVIATLVGVALLVVGATGIFAALQDALNIVWKVKRKGGGGVLRIVKDKLSTFLIVFAVGGLLFVSILTSTLLTALYEQLPGGGFGAQALNFVFSFLVLVMLFGLIYKVVPDVEIGWQDVWLGASMTALVFTLGNFVIGIYLGRAGAASPYGAAGSFIVLLVWIYYAAQLFLFGAEFTRVYTIKRGSRLEPAKGAEFLTRVEHAAEVGEAAPS
jgi:membrane protein